MSNNTSFIDWDDGPSASTSANMNWGSNKSTDDWSSGGNNANKGGGNNSNNGGNNNPFKNGNRNNGNNSRPQSGNNNGNLFNRYIIHRANTILDHFK